MHIIGDDGTTMAMIHQGEEIQVPLDDWAYQDETHTSLNHKHFYLFLSASPHVQRIFFLKSGLSADAFRQFVEEHGEPYRLAPDGTVPVIEMSHPAPLVKESEKPETIGQPAAVDATSADLIEVLKYALGILTAPQ